jgi:hypothetical protein
LIDYCAAVVSDAVVSVEVVSASTAGVSVAVVSADSASSVLPPPHATNANAKPHTINNAINFFIVYRFLKFIANILVLADSSEPGKKKLFFLKD